MERSIYLGKLGLGNHRWHKRCFKCCWCNKFLNATNSNVHQGFLFCKHCLEAVTQYGRPNTYPDTTVIKPEQTHSTSQGCPRCGGAVFEMEKVIEKGQAYHKQCFRCIQCNRPQDDRLQVHIGTDNQLYCQVCYPKSWHTPIPVNPEATTWIKPGPEDWGCPRCEGKVFEAEKMVVGHGVYHKRCFSCRICLKLIDYFSCFSHQNEIFCKSCYQEYFDLRSKSLGPVDTSRIRGDFERRDACPRCGGIVFEAEKIGARYRDYHKKCLSCLECSHLLDATNFCDAPDGEVYCFGCYSANFGIKSSRAKSIGAVDTRLIRAPEGDVARCPNCGGRVFEAEKLVSRNSWYHKGCFKCFKCNHMLDQTNFNDGPDGRIYCKTCYKNLDLLDQNQTARSLMDTTAIKAYHGDEEGCPKCGGKVFEAEKKLAKSGAYHKKCFTCQVCNRALDGLSIADAPQGYLLCQPCYKKNFGPSELKVLTQEESQKSVDTTVIKASNKAQGCVRCGGAVFEAEKIMSKGFTFHKRCTTCKTCKKRLDSGSICGGFGSDPEIYCQGCYGRQHGGAGYRGILASQWVDEETSSTFRPTQYTNPAAIKASEGDLSCRKCSGKVFELEKISSKLGTFHKQCFSCYGCHKKLEALLTHYYESKDGGIYCKKCFEDKFGDSTKPMTYTNTSTIKAYGGTGCPRCGGAVFEAEKFLANDRSYHKRCATCFSCSHKLDSQSLYCGKDKEIYCGGCYSRKFGGSGYRGGAHGGNWLDENANILLRPCQNVDTSKLKVQGDPDSCRRCSGKVFELERVCSKSFVWHKQCFSCKSCNMALSSTLVSGFEAPDEDIYCKNCFQKNFGEATRPSTYSNTRIIRASNGQLGCPRCGGIVFEAEKVVAGENAWFHKGCFDCQICHTKLDSVRSAIGTNGDAYCKTCYKNQMDVERSAMNVAKPMNYVKAAPGDPNACVRCQGKVYEAEKMMTNDKCYHKHCFTCKQCSHKLDYTNSLQGPDQDLYCKTCYVSSFFTGGRNRFGDSRGKPPIQNSKDGCVRCRCQVFEIDRVLTKCGKFHKLCLSCAKCERKLDTSNFYEARKDIYCRQCYNETFGVRGRSKSIDGRIHTTKVRADVNDQTRCPRCSGKVFEAEKMQSSVGIFHPACFKCFKCSGNLDQSNCHAGLDGEVYCKLCYTEEFGIRSRRGRSRSRPVSRAGSRPPSSMGMDEYEFVNNEVEDSLAKSVVDTTSIMAAPGDKAACPKCRGKVFEAEKVCSNKGMFHKRCFHCDDCRRALDPSIVCDGPQLGQIFCKNCYKKRFGPSVLKLDEASVRRGLDLTRAKSVDPKKACVRCGGGVFAIEEFLVNDSVYHKSCAKCKSCQRLLDISHVFSGKDKEIYCQGCYGRQNGLTGYRGIQSTNWAADQVMIDRKLNGITSKDYKHLAFFKAENETEACIRCKGKVFDAEKVYSAHGLFHNLCFKCADCHIKLDSMSMCDANNKEIYCHKCYGRRFGIHGYGYGGFGSVPALTAGGNETKLDYHFNEFF